MPERCLCRLPRVRRFLLIPVLAAAGGLLAPAAAAPAAEGPAVLSAKPLAAEVRRCERFELACELRLPQGSDPFDPEQVDLRARLVAPSGARHEVAGFLWQDFERKLEQQGEPQNPVEAEALTPKGPPEWRLRFAPNEVGTWRYGLTLSAGGATVAGPEGEFACTESPWPGWVRVSQADPRYLCFDNGKPFFIIGHNVCWPGQRGTYDYDLWLPKMRAGGENFFRLWIMRNDACTLEEPLDPKTGLGGVGNYSLANAWRLDAILEQADRQGLAVMLCVFDFYPFRVSHTWRGQKSSPFGRMNPYNAALGGPITTPEEFFTDPAARKLARRLLRYIAARYGHYRSLAIWELFNELDLVENFNRVGAATVAWHQEMAQHLRSVDPCRHPITTSYASPTGHSGMWSLAEMDLTGSHSYGSTDMGDLMPRTTRELASRFRKPTLFGEFGCDAEFVGERIAADPRGIHLHNGIWASALSGAAGTALSWWWDNYIEPRDHYAVFKPLADFLADVPWTTAAFAAAEPTFEPLAGTGAAAAQQHVHQYLHGSTHADLQGPISLLVDLPAAGQCVLRVKQVSVGGILVARLDGQQVLRQFLPAGKGAGPWKSSALQQPYDNWVAVYDADYAFDIGPGTHTVAVENLGRDWIQLESITFTQAGGKALRLPCGGQWDDKPVNRLQASRDGALAELPALALRCVGLQSRDRALLWIQNAGHTWKKCGGGAAPQPQAPARVSIGGLARGAYTVVLWDTYAGKPLRTLEVLLGEGPLRVELPAIATDLALKAVRTGP